MDRIAIISLEEYDQLKKVSDGQGEAITLTNRFVFELHSRMEAHVSADVRAAYSAAMSASLKQVKGCFEASGPDSIRVVSDPTL